MIWTKEEARQTAMEAFLGFCDVRSELKRDVGLHAVILFVDGQPPIVNPIVNGSGEAVVTLLKLWSAVLEPRFVATITEAFARKGAHGERFEVVDLTFHAGVDVEMWQAIVQEDGTMSEPVAFDGLVGGRIADALRPTPSETPEC